MWHRSLLIALFLAGWTGSSPGLEHVKLKYQKQEVEIAGRVLVEAQDGGLMVQTRDGTIWNVQPEDLIRRARDDVAFRPFSAEEMSRQIVAELPSGFDAYRTASIT